MLGPTVYNILLLILLFRINSAPGVHILQARCTMVHSKQSGHIDLKYLASA